MSTRTAIQITRSRAFSWVAFQIFAVILASGMTYGWGGLNRAKEIALGGAIAILPNLIFALVLFGLIDPRRSTQMLAALYLGETLKLFLTGVIFLFVLSKFAVTIGALLAGMLIAIAAFWLAPLVTSRLIK